MLTTLTSTERRMHYVPFVRAPGGADESKEGASPLTLKVETNTESGVRPLLDDVEQSPY